MARWQRLHTRTRLLRHVLPHLDAGPPPPASPGTPPTPRYRLRRGPPPPASPGTPPTPRTDSAGDPLPRLRRVLPRLRGPTLRGTPSPGFAGYSPDSAGEREALQAIRRAISPGTGWPLSSSAAGAPGSELNVAICATSIRCGR